MNDRVALISGGARGIGRAVALDLAARGWWVAICYRTSAEEARTVVDAVKARGAGGLALQCDVSDPKAAVEWVEHVNKEWGRVDALINGAGPYHRVSLLEETNEGWHSMFDNNLHPVFYLSKAVIPIMKERKWGRIICFSMANAEQLIAQPQLTAHYITKVGLLRSEEHTSELQSLRHLVCRLLLEKKNDATRATQSSSLGHFCAHSAMTVT